MKIYAVVEQYEDNYDGVSHWVAKSIKTYHATKELAEAKIKANLDSEMSELYDKFQKKELNYTYFTHETYLLSNNEISITDDSSDYREREFYQVSKYIVQELEVEE
jgi:uncharacterized protein YgiM (DUF1202 family)